MIQPQPYQTPVKTLQVFRSRNSGQFWLATLLVIFLSAFAAFPSRAVDLRGFGSIKEADLPDRQGVRFDCDSSAHAVALIEKLARDMAASATVPAQWTTIAIAGHNAPVLIRPGLGAYLVLARGASAYCFTTPLAVGQPFSSLTFPAAAPYVDGAVFHDPAFTYPVYLDKWSSAGIGSWYPYPWGDKFTTGYSNTIDDHFTFARKYDLAVQPNTGRDPLDNLLPKIHQYGRPYHFAQWMDWSPSLAILAPEDLFMPSSLFTFATIYYGEVSFGSQKLEDYRNWDWGQSVKEHVTDPNLVDWLDPNGEIGAVEWHAPWDFSEDNRANMVKWLREVKGYSLAALGEAWYGNPRRFDAWNNVQIPKAYDFYGFRPGDLLAGKTWRIHTASADIGLKAGYGQEKFPEDKWVTFQMPGGEVSTIEWQAQVPTWYRGDIEVPESWLHRRPVDRRIYLDVASLSSAEGPQKPDRVWFNGKELSPLTAAGGSEILGQREVTGLLHPGHNSIVYLPANPGGGIHGVFFLSVSPLETYPFSDTRLNVRYSDWEEYCAWCAVPRVEATLKAIRGIDPDRPIKIHAAENRDLFIPLMAKYGAYPHNTGNGSFLRSWDKRYGYVWGIPASAELGGPFETDIEALKRYVGFFIFQGINAFDQFHNIQDMMYHPGLNEIWAEYMPYLHLANRSDIKKPDIALFLSHRNLRLPAPRSIPYTFDLGRGDLQTIGYSYVYVDESSLAAGLVNTYPVLWDTGSAIMDDATVTKLKAYVENGGTYVAIQDTGRHTLTQSDAWPISSLTGFNVREIRPMGKGSVTILKSQPIFTKLAGKTFANRGRSIDYSDYNFADKCLALVPAAPGVQALARYQDGAIAAGMRHLGKGCIITLGSPFWRDSYDKLGYWHPGDAQSDFLEDILAGLGLHPLCTSDDRQVWREQYITNNGAEKYLALWNQSDKPQTAKLSWHTSRPSTALYDPRTGAQVSSSSSATTTEIRNISLKPYETVILTTQNMHTPQQSVSDWFKHLALWERPSAPGVTLQRPDVPLYEIDLADKIFGAVVPAAAFSGLDLAAMSSGSNAPLAWRTDLGRAEPEMLGVSVPPTGHMVYRVPIAMPATWQDGDTYFFKFIPVPGTKAGIIGLYLNGQKLPDMALSGQVTGQVDISSQLLPGKPNLLIISSPASGSVGRLYIERQPRPLDSIDVSGQFDVQATEDSGLVPATLPGSFNGLFAFKNDIAIPTSWKGSRIFIRITPGNLLDYAGFAVNEKVVFHPLDGKDRITYMDITPWIKVGVSNRLLLIPQEAARIWKPGNLAIQRITLERVADRNR